MITILLLSFGYQEFQRKIIQFLNITLNNLIKKHFNLEIRKLGLKIMK